MRNFNEIIDRSNTEATKWERYRHDFKDNYYLPLWIADMDLPCSEAIQAALSKRAQHPIYGYTDRDISYCRLFANRFTKRYTYSLDASEIVLSTGVMYSITCAIRLFSKENDAIVVLTPSYPPFITAIENSNRKVLKSEMKHDCRFEIDFDDLDNKLGKATILLLCNPHNPTGRVFGKEELEKIASLCEKHHTTIIVDEIHCDITYPNHDFYPIMMISEYTRQHTIACVSPTKTFNMAGLKISAVIIKNREWKDIFEKEASAIGISSINLFAMEAVKAAYLHSDQWQEDVLCYLDSNRAYIDDFMRIHAPKVSYVKPEGTYFYWLDFSAYQNCENFFELFKDQCFVILSSGETFDEHCKGWLRLNFACPQYMIKQALQIICKYLEKEKIT